MCDLWKMVISKDGRMCWVRIPDGKLLRAHRGQIRIKRKGEDELQVIPFGDGYVDLGKGEGEEV